RHACAWSNAVTPCRQRIKAHESATVAAADTENSDFHVEIHRENAAKGIVETGFQSALNRQPLRLPVEQVTDTNADVGAAAETEQAFHVVAVIHVHTITTPDRARAYTRRGRRRIVQRDRRQQAELHVMDVTRHDAGRVGTLQPVDGEVELDLRQRGSLAGVAVVETGHLPGG